MALFISVIGILYAITFIARCKHMIDTKDSAMQPNGGAIGNFVGEMVILALFVVFITILMSPVFA